MRLCSSGAAARALTAFDEVWQGVHHIVAGPSFEHAHLAQQLGELLGPLARAAGQIRSPEDETWQKLPFYADHQVDEIVIIEMTERRVAWLGLRAGAYEPVDRSGLIELGPVELAERLDWS